MSATAKAIGPAMPAVKVNVEVVAKGDLAKAALVVVRMVTANRDFFQAVLGALHGKVPPGTPVVVISPGKSIEVLDAEQMAKHGWVRQEPNPPPQMEQK